MNQRTCIIVGGGYAGINAVKAINKTLEDGSKGNLRLILMDKHPYHLRKVLLFKPAAGDADIRIPFADLFPTGVQFVQGSVSKIESEDKRLRYIDTEGQEQLISYDTLVVALGSMVRQPDVEQGGIALTGLDTAAAIRERWGANLRQAAVETNAQECKRLLTVAVAGAGISGIETSAELAHAMREDAAALGLDPAAIRMCLINSQSRLFPDGPVKVGRKLERTLNQSGVNVIHRVKALQEKDGTLSLSDGSTISVGLCVWTLGLQPNPMLRRTGLPVTSEGQVIVDSCYRVDGAPGVYSIGDCARIVDPASGRADGMTCKEGSAQAARLAKVIAADLTGRPAPSHKGFMDFFCFGLGPDRGMVWTRQWGLDIIITGKLGAKIRKMTWDLASLVK